jgi:acetyl/propionyl-CoA carboxylase alpha subunit
MGEAALRVVKATDYVNAGTVEFLMDEDKNFYFLEMNTRLQVEHPVTEMVTGLDLVREQIRIASGKPLSLEQDQLQMRGWAMECRIYAEDPDHGFMPSPGVIRALSEPQGPGIRVDSGVYEGCEISIHYDPLMAKLVAAGSDRLEAIARMKRALKEYRLQGIKSNLAFFVSLLSDDEFVAGRLSTKFIEEFNERQRQDSIAPACPDAAAVVAALAYRKKEGVSAVGRPSSAASSWRVYGRPDSWRMGGR